MGNAECTPDGTLNTKPTLLKAPTARKAQTLLSEETQQYTTVSLMRT